MTFLFSLFGQLREVRGSNPRGEPFLFSIFFGRQRIKTRSLELDFSDPNDNGKRFCGVSENTAVIGGLSVVIVPQPRVECTKWTTTPPTALGTVSPACDVYSLGIPPGQFLNCYLLDASNLLISLDVAKMHTTNASSHESFHPATPTTLDIIRDIMYHKPLRPLASLI